MKALQIIKEMIKQGSTERMGTFTYLPFDDEENRFIKCMFGNEFKIFGKDCHLQINTTYLYSYDILFMAREIPDLIIENDEENEWIYLFKIE